MCCKSQSFISVGLKRRLVYSTTHSTLRNTLICNWSERSWSCLHAILTPTNKSGRSLCSSPQVCTKGIQLHTIQTSSSESVIVSCVTLYAYKQQVDTRNGRHFMTDIRSKMPFCSCSTSQYITCRLWHLLRHSVLKFMGNVNRHQKRKTN